MSIWGCLIYISIYLAMTSTLSSLAYNACVTAHYFPNPAQMIKIQFRHNGRVYRDVRAVLTKCSLNLTKEFNMS